MKKDILIIIFGLIILSLIGSWYVYNKKENNNPQPPPPQEQTPVAQASYICNEEKNIEASFYKGEPKPVNPGEMPIPSGSVKISLSDGRNFDLPQTISADGSRYANNDESFVFWSKGNGALVLENNEEKSFIGCIVVAKDPGDLPKIYSDGGTGFSIRYPADYSVDNSYKYKYLGPEKDISGVKFIIPESLAEGKNLSSKDTGISVEIIPDIQECRADLFVELGENEKVETVNENGIDYSYAISKTAGVGNIYEEQIWALPGTNPCVAVRYFIHSTNIANYPEGEVSEFDHDSLINQFEKIRRTLITI